MLAELEADFRNAPHKLFTEHDIHAHLRKLVEVELEKQGERLIRSKDGQTTSLIHLEYPTPFRCDMKNYNFRVTIDNACKGYLHWSGVQISPGPQAYLRYLLWAWST